MIWSGRMIRIRLGNLTRNWLKNCSESSHSEDTDSFLSSVRVWLTPPFNRCHREGPTSLFELRNTIQVVPFILSPQDNGTAESANQTLHGLQPRAAYGTMLSTVILVKRNREVFFVERDVWGHGPDDMPVRSTDRSTDRVFRFKLAVVPASS